MPTRETSADLIVKRLVPEKEHLASIYRSAKVPHFIIDDLLPAELAQRIYAAFPPTSQMRLRKSLRELKYVTAQMNQCEPLREEAIFAFHDPRIVEVVEEITGLREIEADRLLYAGGISVMARGNFLSIGHEPCSG